MTTQSTNFDFGAGYTPRPHTKWKQRRLQIEQEFANDPVLLLDKLKEFDKEKSDYLKKKRNEYTLKHKERIKATINIGQQRIKKEFKSIIKTIMLNKIPK